MGAANPPRSAAAFQGGPDRGDQDRWRHVSQRAQPGLAWRLGRRTTGWLDPHTAPDARGRGVLLARPTRAVGADRLVSQGRRRTARHRLLRPHALALQSQCGHRPPDRPRLDRRQRGRRPGRTFRRLRRAHPAPCCGPVPQYVAARAWMVRCGRLAVSRRPRWLVCRWRVRRQGSRSHGVSWKHLQRGTGPGGAGHGHRQGPGRAAAEEVRSRTGRTGKRTAPSSGADQPQQRFCHVDQLAATVTWRRLRSSVAPLRRRVGASRDWRPDRREERLRDASTLHGPPSCGRPSGRSARWFEWISVVPMTTSVVHRSVEQ